MQSEIRTIVKILNDIHLTILVNNVGDPPSGMKPPYRPLYDYSLSDIDGIIDMNLGFTVHITASVLPLYYQHKKVRINHQHLVYGGGRPSLDFYVFKSESRADVLEYCSRARDEDGREACGGLGHRTWNSDECKLQEENTKLDGARCKRLC